MDDADETPKDADAILWRKQRLQLRDEFRAIAYFLCEKEEAGRITHAEAGAIARAANDVFRQAGLAATDDTAIAVAVDRQSLHRMRQAIIEIHPEPDLS